MAARKHASTRQARPERPLRAAGSRRGQDTPPMGGESFYRDLVENANDAIAVLSLEGLLTWVNRGAERLLGWTRVELVGQHYRIVTTPASAQLVEERTQRFIAGDKPASSIFEGELVHKDGTIIPVEARTRVIRDGKGRVTGFQGIYRDLTERKRVEQERRTREAFFQAVLEHATDMIVLLDADGAIRYSSPSAARLFGYPPADTTGASGFDFVHPEDLPGVADAFQSLLTTPGESTVIELRVRHHDGSWRVVEATGTNLLHDPSVAGIVINSRDVTARRASEERYRLVSQSISDYAFSFSLDAQGTLSIDWLTDSFTTITGYAVEDIIGAPDPLRLYVHPDDLADVLRTMRALQPGVKTTYEFRILTKTGKVRRVQSHAQAVADASGRLVRLYGAARDVTAERTTEQRLRESEALYRSLVENAPDVIYTLDVNGMLASLNPAFTVHTGWEVKEWEGKPFGPLLHPDDLPLATRLFQQVIAGQSLPEFRLRVRSKSGPYRVGEFRAVPQKDHTNQVVAVVGVSRNITDRIEAEQQLHESRNLLTRIADTIPDILFLYDFARGQVVYINKRVTSVLGYTPEQIQHHDPTALRALLHPDDVEPVAAWETRMVGAADEELLEVDYRVKHVNGAYRWFHVQASICTRTAEGAPQSMLGIAEDITARQQLRALARERVIDLAAVPERLRQFREFLNMTQAKFGQTFGGHDQRQIGSYERGDTEPSLKLLASIHNQGYALETILGAGSSPVLDETLAYLTAQQNERVVGEQLAVTLLELVRHDRERIERIMQELGLPTKALTTQQKQVLAQLVALTAARTEDA